MTDDEAENLAEDMKRDEADRKRMANDPSNATACYALFARMILGDSRVHEIIDGYTNGRTILGTMFAKIREEDNRGGFPNCEDNRRKLLHAMGHTDRWGDPKHNAQVEGPAVTGAPTTQKHI